MTSQKESRLVEWQRKILLNKHLPLLLGVALGLGMTAWATNPPSAEPASTARQITDIAGIGGLGHPQAFVATHFLQCLELIGTSEKQCAEQVLDMAGDEGETFKIEVTRVMAELNIMP